MITPVTRVDDPVDSIDLSGETAEGGNTFFLSLSAFSGLSFLLVCACVDALSLVRARCRLHTLSLTYAQSPALTHARTPHAHTATSMSLY